MASLNPIRACLEQYLLATAGIPAVAIPNVKFDPDPKVPFIRVQFVPTSKRPANVGPNPLERYEGLYQLNVYHPSNEGEGYGLNIADVLMERFKPSTSIVFGGEEVGIMYSEVGLPFPDAPFYTTPVTVGWYAYA